MQDVSPHILKLVKQVAGDVLVKAEDMATKPNSKIDQFWSNDLDEATTLLRCLSNAYLHDKPIHKIYRLDRSEMTVYGIPVPSTDTDRNFDFLVLDGNGYRDTGIIMQIQRSDSVGVWHTFRSVVL